MEFKLRILLVVGAFIGNASSQVYFTKGAPHVKLTNGGIISGSLANSRDGRPYTSFIGIQYATVPERFGEPQLITEPWEGVRAAVKPGSLCPQRRFPISPDGDTFGNEEDCLNLNIYVPMNNTGKRGYPVMVYIHGGGFVVGGGLGYGPKFFMDEDVILVTLNYRLGVFGFLSTGDEILPGNYGLKDQVMALNWVQANIKQFGGDPGKVTIFGTSAGGVSVHYLLLSQMAKGLFHRAISQSGTALALWGYDPNPRENAVKLATHLKCPTEAPAPDEISSQEILTCLKGLTTEELNKAQWTYKSEWPKDVKPFHFVPTREPEAIASSSHKPILSQSPWTILQDKNQPLIEIPWIVGCTEDEGSVMYSGVILKNDELTQELDSNWNNIAPIAFDYDNYLPKEEQDVVSQKIRDFYFPNSLQISRETRQNLTNLYSDQLFLHSVFRAGVETASRGKRNTVYLYQYAYHAPISIMGMTLRMNDESLAKVGHGDDIVLQFDFGQNIPGVGEFVKPDTPDEEFSKNIVKMWASFATHGEPKHSWGSATYRKWKSITKKELDGVYPMRWYRLDENPSSIDDPYKERVAFWDQLWQEHFGPALASKGVGNNNSAKTEL